MGRLDGKVALITGAARGQGRSHAVTLAREGAQIVATDLCEQIESVPYALATQADLDETVRLVEDLDQRALGIKADARSSDQMRAAVEETVSEFGRLDILVVNHGTVIPVGWEQMTDDIWDEQIETLLSAVWRTTRAAIPQMIEQGGGSIVFTSSVAGLTGYYSMAAYTAAKHGVIGLMRALSADLAPSWIRVNAVCPTNVATPLLHNQTMLDLFTGKPGATVEDMAWPAQTMNLLPIPWVEPEDVSNAVLFLASEESRYMTGVALPVDAGLLNQPPGVPPMASQRIAELSSGA
jgi:SDR family mycofactocin-dependent oxidoreductase